MAKVMISVPDEMLAEADRLANSLGTTRSGYIQRLIDGDLESRNEASRSAIAGIIGMAGAASGSSTFSAAELVKQSRPKL